MAHRRARLPQQYRDEHERYSRWDEDLPRPSYKRRRSQPSREEIIETEIRRFHEPLLGTTFHGCFDYGRNHLELCTITISPGDPLREKLRKACRKMRKTANNHNAKFEFGIDTEVTYTYSDYYSPEGDPLDENGNDPATYYLEGWIEEFEPLCVPEPTGEVLSVTLTDDPERDYPTTGALSRFSLRDVVVLFQEKDQEYEDRCTHLGNDVHLNDYGEASLIVSMHYVVELVKTYV